MYVINIQNTDLIESHPVLYWADIVRIPNKQYYQHLIAVN